MIEIYVIYLLIIVLIAIKFYTHFSSIQKLNDTYCYIYDSHYYSPYYYYQYALDKHVFSPKLASLISIKNNAPFTLLLMRLELQDRQELNKLYKHYYNLLINSSSLNLIPRTDLSLFFKTINIEIFGQIKYFKCYATIVGDLYAKPKGFIIYFQDVTEDTKYYNELVNQNYKVQTEFAALNNLLNAIPYPIWLRDDQLNIYYFNFAYSQLLSNKMDETFNSSTLELNPQITSLAKNAIIAKHPQTINDYLIINNHKRLHKITEVPITNTSGGFGIDLSNISLLEEQLMKYKLAESELLGAIPYASAIYDQDTKLRCFNQTFISLWGLNQQWLSSSPSYSQILENLREKRKLPEQANFVNFKDSQLKLFKDLLSIHTELLYLPDGKILQMVVIPYALGGRLFSYEDISDRLEKERICNVFINTQQSMLDHLFKAAAIFENNRLKLYNAAFAQYHRLNADNSHFSHPHIADLLLTIKEHFVDDDWDKLQHNIILKMNNREEFSIIIKQINGQNTNFAVSPLPDGTTLLIYYELTNSNNSVN